MIWIKHNIIQRAYQSLQTSWKLEATVGDAVELRFAANILKLWVCDLDRSSLQHTWVGEANVVADALEIFNVEATWEKREERVREDRILRKESECGVFDITYRRGTRPTRLRGPWHVEGVCGWRRHPRNTALHRTSVNRSTPSRRKVCLGKGWWHSCSWQYPGTRSQRRCRQCSQCTPSWMTSLASRN